MKYDSKGAELVPVKFKDGKIFIWYSFCSAHRDYDEHCEHCNSGLWHKVCLADNYSSLT